MTDERGAGERRDDEREAGERELTVADALNEALVEEMERDPEVVLIGEDIRMPAGVGTVTAGCYERFGGARVVNAPISEGAIAGFAVGSALLGARPVVDVQIADFVTLMMDQLVNHAAKWRYMSGGQVSVPIVVRCPTFTGVGMAAQHSQSLEAWFVHTPGLVVAMPATAADAKGLLKSAIRDDNPVVFFEKRLGYGLTGPVPAGEHLVPLGQADVKRSGNDATVVTYGGGVFLALQAARRLAREGIEVEVVDLRTLQPLDLATVAESVGRTRRAVIVHESPVTGGFGAELASRIVEACFDDLATPPHRVGAADAPVPCALPLERAVLPQVGDVVDAVRAVVGDRAGASAGG